MLVNNFRILAKNRLFRPRSENRCHIINDIRTLSSKSYTERQIETGRPVSPHVTIYAFPVTALSSITNRVTGGALAVGTGGIGTLALLGVLNIFGLLIMDHLNAFELDLVPLMSLAPIFFPPLR